MTVKKKPPYTVLVVEDVPGLVRAITAHLTKIGCTVRSASTVDDAIQILESNDPPIDFVWLDHYLPEKNGIELLHYLKDNKEHPEFASIPVFLVSNTVTEEKTRAYLSLGADGYYLKAKKSLEEISKDLIARIEAGN